MSWYTRAAAVIVAALLTLLLLPAAAAPAAAGESGVFVGGCVLSGTLSFSQPVGAAPAPVWATLSTRGPCVVNGVLATGGINGTLGAVAPATCAAGVFSGGVMFEPGTGMAAVAAQLQLAYTPGPMAIATHRLPSFAGVGAFAGDAVAAAACAAGGAVSAVAVSGTLVFEDPEVPAP